MPDSDTAPTAAGTDHPSPAPTLAAATPEMAEALAEVHVRSWQQAYAGLLDAAFLGGLDVADRARRWRHILAQGQSQNWVSLDGDRVTGFVSVGPCRDAAAPPSRGEVWALYVHPDDWRHGQGRLLLAQGHALLRAAGFDTASLWVLAGNDRARRFYARCGYADVPGTGQSFELGGRTVDEVRMQARLA